MTVSKKVLSLRRVHYYLCYFLFDWAKDIIIYAYNWF